MTFLRLGDTKLCFQALGMLADLISLNMAVSFRGSFSASRMLLKGTTFLESEAWSNCLTVHLPFTLFTRLLGYTNLAVFGLELNSREFFSDFMTL